MESSFTFLLNDDDIFDISHEFKELWRQGKNADDISKELCKQFSPLLDNEINEKLFWIIVADLQWKHGILQPSLSERVNTILSNDLIMIIPKGGRAEKSINLSKIINGIRKKMSSPIPRMKKITNPKLFKCAWSEGDVHAYKLNGDKARGYGFDQEYLLVQKVDEYQDKQGNIYPIVRVKLTRGGVLPASQEEWDTLDYIQMQNRKYEDRFLPFDGRKKG